MVGQPPWLRGAVSARSPWTRRSPTNPALSKPSKPTRASAAVTAPSSRGDRPTLMQIAQECMRHNGEPSPFLLRRSAVVVRDNSLDRSPRWHVAGLPGDRHDLPPNDEPAASRAVSGSVVNQVGARPMNQWAFFSVMKPVTFMTQGVSQNHAVSELRSAG